MEPILKVNAPAVVAEVIDGEAVIMDLASGHYFSTQHVGCEIWRAIDRGASRSAIVATLVSTYEVEPLVASEAVATFVGELMERKLVVETNGEARATEQPVNGSTEQRLAFASPVLNSYTDMEELLLLDPIHDVDQAGWPMPKSADAPSS